MMGTDAWGQHYGFDEAWEDCGSSEFLAPGAGDAFRAACAGALVRLPLNVREFALERCSIFTIGRGTRATCWPGSRKKRWIIVANESMRGNVESTIAHEIAHAWLGHTPNEPIAEGELTAILEGEPPANERAADDLIVKWGFKRCYRRRGASNRLLTNGA